MVYAPRRGVSCTRSFIDIIRGIQSLKKEMIETAEEEGLCKELTMPSKFARAGAELKINDCISEEKAEKNESYTYRVRRSCKTTM